MLKKLCDRCKKEIERSEGEVDFDSYFYNIIYRKIFCNKCAIDIMNVIDYECDRYKLKINVEREE